MLLRVGTKMHLAAGVGAASPVDAHRLGGVQLLLQLLHNMHGPVLGLNHCQPAELQQHRELLRDSNVDTEIPVWQHPEAQLTSSFFGDNYCKPTEV